MSEERNKVIDLSLKMTDAITAEHSFSDVFNALSLATVACILDYLITTGEEVSIENAKIEAERVALFTEANIQSILSQSDLIAKVQAFKEA